MRVWLLAACLLLTTNYALAFRCGRQLVHEGDHKTDVLDKCGEPYWMDERIAVRGSRFRHPFGALEISDYEEVLIEEWTYNFGRRKFKQFLQFENGVLMNIKSLGYGF